MEEECRTGGCWGQEADHLERKFHGVSRNRQLGLGRLSSAPKSTSTKEEQARAGKSGRNLLWRWKDSARQFRRRSGAHVEGSRRTCTRLSEQDKKFVAELGSKKGWLRSRRTCERRQGPQPRTATRRSCAERLRNIAVTDAKPISVSVSQPTSRRRAAWPTARRL